MWGYGSATAHLHSMCKTLGSIPSMEEKGEVGKGKAEGKGMERKGEERSGRGREKGVQGKGRRGKGK